MIRNKLFAMFIIGIGLLLLLYPLLSIRGFSIITTKVEYASLENKPWIREEITAYNKKLVNKTPSIVDPFIIEDFNTPPAIKEAGEKAVGVIFMPTIGEKLPIYLGATHENMKKGVCQIDGTSLPFGGVSTRSVLATHNGNQYNYDLHKISRLNVGDPVFIYTLGERRTYTVIDHDMIYPTENNKLIIEENKDILTLLTTGSYPQNDTRHIVNAIRKHENQTTISNVDEDIKRIKREITINESLKQKYLVLDILIFVMVILILLSVVNGIALIVKSK